MTIKEVIEKVNLPGDIPDSIKYRWVGELDGERFRFPEDADTELTYSFDLYEKYLIALNDFFTGNMYAYVDSAREFERVYAEERGISLCFGNQ